ncbi:MAG: hypothetical protein ACI85K_000957 [Hyphomicrobiaceae bacterium]|jgi:hypothetical protein
MVVEGDAFWRAICLAANEQDAQERRELQEAEEELRELEAELDASELDAPELDATDGADGQKAWRHAQIDQRLVDQWVAGAVGSDSDTRAKASMPSNLRAVPAREPRRARPWQALLAAAAAFMVTPKFLVAATLAASIAVTGALLQRTTTTLPFEHAINLLLDVEQPEAIRESAGGRVFFDVVESIQLLIELAESDSSIATPALDALQDLLAVEPIPIAFEHADFTEPLSGLADQLHANDASWAVRQQSLDSLVEQVIYGMQAMHAIASRLEPSPLVASSALHLQQIESLLNR